MQHSGPSVPRSADLAQEPPADFFAQQASVDVSTWLLSRALAVRKNGRASNSRKSTSRQANDMDDLISRD